MWIYQVGPIDFHWNLLPTVEEFLKNKSSSLEEGTWWGVDWSQQHATLAIKLEQYRLSAEIVEKLNKHLEFANNKMGWEGDFNYEPRIFFIPNPDDFSMDYGFVWKQGNNGTTFVVSPVLLNHLISDSYCNLVEYVEELDQK